MTGEQNKGPTSCRIDERQARIQQGADKIRGRRFGQSFRQPQQALALEVERTGNAHRLGLLEPQASREMAEVLAHGQRRRGEDPGTASRPHLTLKTAGDFKGQQMQDKAAVIRSSAERAPSISDTAAMRVSCVAISDDPPGQTLDRAVLRQCFEFTGQCRHCMRQVQGSLRQFRWALLPWGATGPRRQRRAQPAETVIDGAQRKLQAAVRLRGLRTDGVENLGQAPCAAVRAKELHGQIRQLMRFIDHHGIRGAEHIPEAILLQRQIGQQQVMIDDHHLCLLRFAPRLHQVAASEFGTPLP